MSPKGAASRRTFCIRSLALGPAAFLVLLLSGAQPALAESAELKALFPREADVFVGQDSRAGLARLLLPAAVLAECRPDLSDLRLFDRGEREVPFLVDSLSPAATLESRQRFDGRVVEYFREEIRRESGPPLRRERFIVQAPGRTAREDSWVLVVETSNPEFVSRAKVSEASGGSTKVLAEGSIFRIPRTDLAGKMRLALPGLSADRVEVTLESEEASWLAPTFRFESAGVLERGGRMVVPLEILSRQSADGASILDLARPSGIVPDLLRLETGTRAFDRRVQVRDEGPGIAGEGDDLLASGKLFRLETLAVVENVEIPLRPARGQRLRITIVDGDSPPLENLEVMAVVRQPSLIFPFSASEKTLPVATLRFGGGRAHLPKYDLASFSSAGAEILRGDRGRAAAGLHHPSVLAQARLGEIRPHAGFDRSPALDFAMRPGAEIDSGAFSHRRIVRVPGSPEGLVRVPLTPADGVVLGESLSDLRIVDRASRQWPYLLERDASTALVELRVEGPTRSRGASRYRLEPNPKPVRLDRLVLETESAFFDRVYRLTGTGRQGVEESLAGGRLVRGRNDRRPITLDVPARQYEEIVLEIEDGDDAPLALTVRGRALLPDVYLAAPAGEYTMLMGDPDEKAPQYELARVRDVVLAIRSETAFSGDLEANPGYSVASRLAGDGRKQQVLLWAALAAAVVTLSVLTLRLVRRQTSASS